MSYKPGTIWVTLSLLLKLQQGTIVNFTKCGTGLNRFEGPYDELFVLKYVIRLT